MELDYKDIGPRIKSYRKSLGLSQQKLAEMSNQEPSNVSHIERGTTKLSLPTLVHIANALNVTADDLLCGSIPAASVAIDREAAHILEDCTHEERKIIVGTMRALKSSFKESVGWNRLTLPGRTSPLMMRLWEKVIILLISDAMTFDISTSRLSSLYKNIIFF